MKTFLQLLAITSIFLSQTGFVLLSPHKATLPVTTDLPKITFQWDGSYPEMTDKDKLEGGAYAGLDDQAFMQQLLTIAVDRWNTVRGSFLRMEVLLSNTPVSMDPEDKVFSLVVEPSDNASSAAYAAPQMDENETTIIDCDINIASRKTDAESLLFTLVHELGHCIGLGHAHSNYGAIMGYSRTERKATLGADDKAGLIFLYPDPAYVDGNSKELVSCGVTGSRKGPDANIPGLLLLAMVVLGAFYSLRPNSKNGARGRT